MGFYSLVFISKVVDFKLYSLKTGLLRKNFDLLRNSRPTVPMYADGRALLVFRTFLQSLQRAEKNFSTRCKDALPLEVRLLYNHLKGIQNTVNIRKNFAVPRIIALQTFLHRRKAKIQAIHGVVLDKIRLAVLRLRVKGKIDRQSA